MTKDGVSKKVALITGVTGQDGAYLAEFLLKKGYEVHGIKRRASSFNTNRVDHLYQDPHESERNFILHYGDLTDAINLIRIMQNVQPDEVYNLAAQSHVAVSFESPEYTANADALGTLRLLEAIRILGLESKTHLYQASTSEMFGKVQEIPQKETTPFYPRSPYGAAKVYAYWIVVNYREAYGMYACNGILFNHECMAADTPLLVRANGTVDVRTPEELVPLRCKGPSTQIFEVPGLEVWDGAAWTPVHAISATRRRRHDPEHALLAVQARAGIVAATAHHHLLDANQSVLLAKDAAEGQRLLLADRFPETPGLTRLAPELAEFLGLLTADGYVPKSERRSLQFTNNDPVVWQRVATLWSQLFLGQTRVAQGISGFSERSVTQLYMSGAGREVVGWLRSQIYTPRGYKRVPALILNAPLDIQEAYLRGYYLGDGLKAGSGDSVKTNSTVLAQGLYWLYANQGRLASVYLGQRNGQSYYQLNLPTATPLGEKSAHLRRDPAEIRRVDEALPADDEWVFDLGTGSGVFMAGVGRAVVHNSPIRGETFVTRKITRAVARIKLGLQDKLYLGNLDSKRDWGHARDYVEAQWLMLQQPEPGDYVIATGIQYSVRDFVNMAFAEIDVNLEWTGQGVNEKGIDAQTGIVRVEVDPRYFRPTEVDTLLGDSSKAKRKLGWSPKTTLKEMVKEMVKEDLITAERDQLCKQEGYRVFNHFE